MYQQDGSLDFKMDIRPTTQTINNARRLIKLGDDQVTKQEPVKTSLLLRRSDNTDTSKNETEAVALLRRVRKSIANAKA